MNVTTIHGLHLEVDAKEKFFKVRYTAGGEDSKETMEAWHIVEIIEHTVCDLYQLIDTGQASTFIPVDRLIHIKEQKTRE